MPNGRNAEWRCWLICANESKYLEAVCWLCTCFWHKQAWQTLMQNWPEGVRGTLKSLSKVFRSTALPMKRRVKLFQTYFSLDAFRQYWESGGKTSVSNDTVHSRCEVTMSLAQLVRLRRLGWTGHVLHHNEPEVIVMQNMSSPAQSSEPYKLSQ